jgi:hypothetical protein
MWLSLVAISLGVFGLVWDAMDWHSAARYHKERRQTAERMLQEEVNHKLWLDRQKRPAIPLAPGQVQPEGVTNPDA